MRVSPIIYNLYVKTHNITGLKYLGCTSTKPLTYLGSGKHWLRHLKKHGYSVTTEIVGRYNTLEEFREASLYYSDLWNIVESKEWANLCIEYGNGGSGWIGLTPEHRLKAGKRGGAKGGPITGPRSYREGTHLFAMSKEELKKYASLGGKTFHALGRGVHSQEQLSLTRKRMKENHPWKGRKHKEESLELLKNHHSGRAWTTDGLSNKRVKISEVSIWLDKGLVTGRSILWKFPNGYKKCRERKKEL